MTKIIAKIKDFISRFMNVMSNLIEAMARYNNPGGSDYWCGD